MWVRVCLWGKEEEEEEEEKMIGEAKPNDHERRDTQRCAIYYHLPEKERVHDDNAVWVVGR